MASRVPMGALITDVLLDELGLDVGLGVVLNDELRTLRSATMGAFSTVVLAPERGLWPGAGALLSRSVMSRLADRLAPGGRLLAWIDTTDLDARALSARLAAFGDVFGSSSMALLEVRELEAPFVLMVGWRDRAGQPTSPELTARLGPPDADGFRSRLQDLDDLSAMLLFDGDGLAALASSGPVHDRSRPVPPALLAGHGAAAVAGVYSPEAKLSQVTGGAQARAFDQTALLEGMAVHSTYFYELDRLRGSMMVEPLDDVEWTAFDAEVEAYRAAVQTAADNPLLHLAVAALLEPLAREDELTRFAQTFEAINCEAMPSWRLALLHHYVALVALEAELAEGALARARSLAKL